VAARHIPFPEFSYRLLSVDTAYGEKQENSWSAATAWGIWHDKEDAPRAEAELPIASLIAIPSKGLGATILVRVAAERNSRIAVSVDDAALPEMSLGLIDELQI
jgi:hypothetical protein